MSTFVDDWAKRLRTCRDAVHEARGAERKSGLLDRYDRAELALNHAHDELNAVIADAMVRQTAAVEELAPTLKFIAEEMNLQRQHR